MTTANREKINDPAVMRALAHPVRLELLEYLSLAKDGATATECAGVVGLSPSATSYHLRALAKVGMIEEGATRGDGRERVWQPSRRRYWIGGERDAAPADVAAEAAMVEAYLARQNEKVRRYMARVRDEPPEWFDVGIITDLTLLVTADELNELLANVNDLIEPLKVLNREEAPAGARSVSVQIRAVPVV